MGELRTALLTTAILVLFGVCSAGKFKQQCTVDAECQSYYGPKYECDSKDLTCRHELLFPFGDSLGLSELIGFILVVLVAGVANSGGVGGGVMLTPIFIFVFGYTFQESIPLSKATIFAGAIANLFIVVGKPHPKIKGEYLLDYGLSAISLPIVLPGTVTGVILNKSLPPILVLTILVAYLVKTATGIYAKYTLC